MDTSLLHKPDKQISSYTERTSNESCEVCTPASYLQLLKCDWILENQPKWYTWPIPFYCPT